MKKRILTKILSRSLISFIIIVMLGLVAYQSVRNNFHVVIPQQIYRSAQLPAPTLKHIITTKHIASIINLRGSNPDRSWYQHEIAVAQEMHIKHFDLALHAYQLPTTAQLRQLVHLIQTAPRPMLIHCEGGSDRTGMASAFALILHGTTSLPQIEKQFSWHYLVIHKDSVGKLVFPYYIAWLQQHHYSNNKTHFLQWLHSSHPLHKAVLTTLNPKNANG